MAQKWPLPLSLRPALTKHSLRDRLWRTLFRQLFSCVGDAVSEPPRDPTAHIEPNPQSPRRAKPPRCGAGGMQDQKEQSQQLGLKGVHQLGPE